MIPADWTTSSFCNRAACVEVKREGNLILVRSTEIKGRPLSFTHDEWADFVRGVKAGEFDPELV